MSEEKNIRINKVLKELNISLDRAVDFLRSKGIEIDSKPNTKISNQEYNLLLSNFDSDKSRKEESQEISEDKRKEREAIRKELEIEEEKKRKKEEEEKQKQTEKEEIIRAKRTLQFKPIGKIDLQNSKTANSEQKPPEPAAMEQHSSSVKEKELTEKASAEQSTPQKENDVVEQASANNNIAPTPQDLPSVEDDIDKKTSENEPSVIETKYQKLTGPKVVGEKIDLSQFDKKPKKSKNNKEASKEEEGSKKKKRKRISREKENNASDSHKDKKNKKDNKKHRVVPKVELTDEEVQKQVRETLEKLQGKSNKSKGAKYRREKRDSHRQKSEDQLAQLEREEKILKVAEFATVDEVATMMNVPNIKVISACMSLGIMVTMNQRLDAETLVIVADEFGYEVEFITANVEEAIIEQEDKPEDLQPRAPIVTVMGHVDHGKTSLLDYIRKENVVAGESGGITQHIGAYAVKLPNGAFITFLDTPGHEAFTAMRARGTKVTDIAIIVVAADDDVMPQTKEAISHAQAAGVPIIFAINKVDKPNANPEKIKERLAGMNLLVEDWGGKIQSQDISAKKGTGVQELLEKVLLEAELLELRANPNRKAIGTVVEAFLDKGRGYVSTVLVENGTLKVGDYVLAGTNSGKIRAMHDERGKRVQSAGPSTPISILGLDGAPQAGDKFYVFEDEKEAKQLAAKRTQLQREQSVRTQRHITLDEIGRRIALGDFKQLNIILKGDVDGSVEALTDSFQKLSTEEIQVSIIHKGVGAITESDVLLASASDAIIIGFNVRPMANARALADKEQIDIRSYSIIYDAINDVKDAMEGMLSPEMKEEVTGTVEIRELFKISKVGTIAGCMVTDGKIFRNSKIRIIREGVVIYTGELASLKRFKDDVKEVSKGYDCGLQIKNYNDIKEGDVLEAYQEIAVKKKL